MKKIVLVVLVLMFVCEAYAGGFKIIGGANLSKYSVEPMISGVECNHRLGFLAGGGVEISLSPSVSLELDGLYFQKGCQVRFTGSGLKNDYELDVVSGVALLRVGFLTGKSLYILGGGEFSFILSHQMNGLDIERDYDKNDYGIILGGGYELKIAGMSFFVEGRYHIGLNNIIEYPVDKESIKTTAVVALVGIRL